MKSIKKILLVAVLFISVLVLSGCTNKKPITADEFYTMMKGKNFTLTDATSQFSNYDFVKKVYIAQSPDLKYQLEFYELSDEKNATSFYNNNKQIFETSLGQVVKGKLDLNTKEVSKFRATSSGHYMALTRIKNTVLFARIAEDYSKDASSVIKSIGY